MALSYFLKIDGIPGESEDNRHPDEIDVLSLQWGLSQSGTVSAGGKAVPGTVVFQDVQFIMRVNRAVPLLLQAAAEGTHIREAILTARKAGTGQHDFYELRLIDLIVSRVEETGEDEVLQRVSLNYSKIGYKYQRQRADGTLESPVTFGWDLQRNAKA